MKKFYAIILALSLIIASCDNSTGTTNTSTTAGEDENGGGETSTTAGEDKNKDRKTRTTPGEETNGSGGKTPATKPAHSFGFPTKPEGHKVAYTAGGNYTLAVDDKNKPAGDERTISYSSSDPKIATVDKTTGKVTFKTAGTVTITAEKAATREYEKVSNTYTLYITMKPAGKKALVAEIKRAMDEHGNDVDLNYIDTSDITDMNHLFAYGNGGHGLNAFAGDISKWDVSSVTNMSVMFYDAHEFNQNISGWDVSSVTNMASMFAGAIAFNQNISGWDVSSVTNMNSMFAGATDFNLNISGWDISSVINMQGMFSSATAFSHKLDAWEDKFHKKIKKNWKLIRDMFTNSGLTSLPQWCESAPECKYRQLLQSTDDEI